MIKRKLKKCLDCKKDSAIWSKGLCKSCFYLHKPPKKIKKISDKHLETLKEYRVIRDDFMKKNPECMAKLEGCTKVATDCHHSKGKVGSLYTDVRYFKALCRKCHEYLETHPNEAKELGFSLNRL